MAKIDDINEIQHIMQSLSPVDLTKALVMIGHVLADSPPVDEPAAALAEPAAKPAPPGK
jgi:hypothetical protein